MGDLKSVSIKFTSRDAGRSVVIDDDGRVAYAYLLDAVGRIRGDVWLYNRCPAPVEPEWETKESSPFANPEAYVKHMGNFRLPESDDDFSVAWVRESDGYLAKIFFRSEILGVLADDAKPGWAALAKRDGPLARVLEGVS